MDLEDLLNKLLWPHQKDSIEHSRNYIQKYYDTFRREGKDIGAGLNRLPTGTGKSGIITVLCRCFEDDSSRSYVLTPSEYLRDQLCEDIQQSFFAEVLEIDNSLWNTEVKKILPSNALEILTDRKKRKTVYISTIKTLHDIFIGHQETFEKLQEIIQLVIFDEGHREPAPAWANSVRAFSCPKILFTATPYRNDRLKFAVNPLYISAFTHNNALKQNYIRNVKFKSFNEEKIHDFAERLIKYVDNELQEELNYKLKLPRIIIRCSDYHDIETFVKYLISKNKNVLGIHDRFKKSYFEEKRPKYFERKVPNLKDKKEKLKIEHQENWLKEFQKTTPQYWVHQYKLLEGIDEESFCVVANYSPMGNARMLIQQVGRIIRNSKRTKNVYGIYIERKGARDSSFWEGYRKYEERYEDMDFMESLYYKEIFDNYTYGLPEFHYEDDRFRRKFDWFKNELNEDLEEEKEKEKFFYFEHFNYKLSCQIFEKKRLSKKDDKAILKNLSEKVVQELVKEKERDVRLMMAEEISKELISITTYVKRNNSNVLRDLYLFDFKVGYVFIRVTDNYIFFHDSSGGVFNELLKNYKPISAKKLKKLFNKDSKIKNITLRSTDLGNYVFRHQNVSANLNQTVPDLVDHMNFYSNAMGETSSSLHKAQRYIGFTTARITDKSGKNFDFQEYINWTKTLEKRLNKRYHRNSTFFDRYAQYTNVPTKNEAKNILIDFDEISGDFKLKNTDILVHFEDTCFKVKKNKFKMKIFSEVEEKEFEIKIGFNSEKKKYELENKELTKYLDYYEVSQDVKHKHESLIRYLNREQCIRVIPENTKVVYAYRQFYKPEFFPNNAEQSNLLKTFVSIPQLKNMKTEKGKNAVENHWEKNSLFNFVDELGNDTKLKEFLKDIDILFCDDAGGNETCDFIAVSTTSKKIIQIHCKAFKKGKKRSATAFQDVLGQSIKNLPFLVLSNSSRPPNYNTWHNKWSVASVDGKLERLRIWDKNPIAENHPVEKTKIWEHMEYVLRDPSASRQVFIIMGNGFSLDAFEKNLKSRKKDPVNIQIGYLVQNTWSNIRKVASEFKIFCH